MAKKTKKVVKDEDDDNDEKKTPSNAPRSTSYVGMLILSSVALLGAAAFLYLDHDEMASAKKVDPPSVALSEAGLNIPAAIPAPVGGAK